MRVIGVVDLLDGRAVHARAGRRETTRPCGRVAGTAIRTRRRARARAGVRGPSASPSCTSPTSTPSSAALRQDTIVAAMAALGAPLWLDAGVSSVGGARHALELGASHVCRRARDADVIRRARGDLRRARRRRRVAFSLDLRDGEPIVAPERSGSANSGHVGVPDWPRAPRTPALRRRHRDRPRARRHRRGARPSADRARARRRAGADAAGWWGSSRAGGSRAARRCRLRRCARRDGAPRRPARRPRRRGRETAFSRSANR